MTRDPFFAGRAVRVAAAGAGSRVAELTGGLRLPELVRARWAVMLALDARGASQAQIARPLRCDRSTVSYGLRAAAALRQRDPAFAALVERVAAA